MIEALPRHTPDRDEDLLCHVSPTPEPPLIMISFRATIARFRELPPEPQTTRCL